jgi:hypothetical protein
VAICVDDHWATFFREAECTVTSSFQLRCIPCKYLRHLARTVSPLSPPFLLVQVRVRIQHPIASTSRPPAPYLITPVSTISTSTPHSTHPTIHHTHAFRPMSSNINPFRPRASPNANHARPRASLVTTCAPPPNPLLYARAQPRHVHRRRSHLQIALQDLA